MGYSFRLAARVLLYASSHRQDSTYHSLCYTSRGALLEWEIAQWIHYGGLIRGPIAPWVNALTMELHLALKTVWNSLEEDQCWKSLHVVFRSEVVVFCGIHHRQFRTWLLLLQSTGSREEIRFHPLTMTTPWNHDDKDILNSGVFFVNLVCFCSFELSCPILEKDIFIEHFYIVLSYLIK